MKKTYTLAFLTFLCFSGVFAQTSEDSIASPRVWFRADLSTQDGLSWTDDGLYKNHAIAQLQSQLPAPDQLFNFNPALSFDGIDDYLEIPYSLDALAELSALVVFQSADTIERGVWGTKGGLRNILLSTRRALGPDTIHDFYGNNEKVIVLGSLLQTWDNGTLSTVNSVLGIGKAPDLPGLPVFKGALAELIVFNRALSYLERVQIETYLAIKYGTGLRGGNFVSADAKVLWSLEQNAAWSNDISGIGRDDTFKLYQKQSGSAYDSGLLVISAGAMAETNALNTTQLPDKSFILWGGNGRKLTSQKGAEADSILSLIQRKWLVSVHGSGAKDISTEIHVDQSRLPAHDLGYWLVIDRSGRNNFSVDNLEYILPDRIENGKIIYKNVQWDTDVSGGDNFGFARANDLLVVVRKLAAPLCSDEDGGKVRFDIFGGEVPYELSLTNGTAGISREWRSSENSIEQTELVSGGYILSVTDHADEGISREFTLTVPDALAISLGPDRQLSHDTTIVLDVSAQVPDSIDVTYNWENNFGFSSDDEQIAVTESGIYRVYVTKLSDGCVFTDDVIISGGEGQRIAVYPTLISPNENYNISISLDKPGRILVRVYNSRGLMIGEMQELGNTEYQFVTSMKDPGLYLVVVQTPQGIRTDKVIVR